MSDIYGKTLPFCLSEGEFNFTLGEGLTLLSCALQTFKLRRNDFQLSQHGPESPESHWVAESTCTKTFTHKVPRDSVTMAHMN